MIFQELKVRWEVVGGEGKGGILVREGFDLTSAKCEQRLATGSIVAEKKLEGERLQFDLVSGSGPSTGWVSINLKDKPLLVKTDKAPQDPASQAATPGTAGVQDRKLRVLALHGGGANTNIMEFQTSYFKRRLNQSLGGTDKEPKTEWVFLNGGAEWNPANSVDIGQDSFMKAIAKGMPYKGWYKVSHNDDSDRPYIEKLFDLEVEFSYDGVEEAASRVMDHIQAEGPYDAIVGFSQGSIVTHLVTGLLRSRGQEPPWKVSVFFNGMRVRDQKYNHLFEEKLKQPAIMIFGTKDEFYEYGKDSQVSLYQDAVVIEHDEGHKFPTVKPRMVEVFDEVIKHMKLITGFE